MTTHTMNQLRLLKLGGMANALQSQLEQTGAYEGLPFLDRLNLLLDHESLNREHRKHDRLIRLAQFKLRASIQDVDYQHPRNITVSQMATLAQADWVLRAQNLLITGPCGSGKTYLACALGHSACLRGYGVRYFRLSRLLRALTQARADGTYHKQLRQLAKVDLLMIDDWGLEALTPAHRNDIMEIMDDRHDHASTLVISQLPTEEWYACIGDNTLADAILDRLMHNSHRLNLKGESMRKRKAATLETAAK